MWTLVQLFRILLAHGCRQNLSNSKNWILATSPIALTRRSFHCPYSHSFYSFHCPYSHSFHCPYSPCFFFLGFTTTTRKRKKILMWQPLMQGSYLGQKLLNLPVREYCRIFLCRNLTKSWKTSATGFFPMFSSALFISLPWSLSPVLETVACKGYAPGGGVGVVGPLCGCLAGRNLMCQYLFCNSNDSVLTLSLAWETFSALSLRDKNYI